MFDGHNLFEDQEATYGKSWGLKDYLDHSGLPLIVVGMECNHRGQQPPRRIQPIYLYRPSVRDDRRQRQTDDALGGR